MLPIELPVSSIEYPASSIEYLIESWTRKLAAEDDAQYESSFGGN
jgi:hypothetical protein